MRTKQTLSERAYPIRLDEQSSNYLLEEPEIIYSEWDDVANALREGKPREPNEIIDELQAKLDSKKPPLVLKI